MLACGQNVGVNAITWVIPTGISTAEKTRLNASKALSSRTRPVALRTKRLRLPPGGCAPSRASMVATESSLELGRLVVGEVQVRACGYVGIPPWAQCQTNRPDASMTAIPRAYIGIPG